ncbi:hypothetical protein IscW_ISCW008430 [Ixodes scapularis]|uniref:Uncharacterized protein n=1 Tax=Ixodes scapularis TaxID=6945 RepID=B7PVR2_IXOSC|nr:hypothetical protein IscW_ISCW008430 [Ixodes scapularis]|eukprot:XP_002408538.1 hypothetical protein IscW_ISCW008430 [Ixodes scapularis]
MNFNYKRRNKNLNAKLASNSRAVKRMDDRNIIFLNGKHISDIHHHPNLLHPACGHPVIKDRLWLEEDYPMDHKEDQVFDPPIAVVRPAAAVRRKAVRPAAAASFASARDERASSSAVPQEVPARGRGRFVRYLTDEELEELLNNSDGDLSDVEEEYAVPQVLPAPQEPPVPVLGPASPNIRLWPESRSPSSSS